LSEPILHLNENISSGSILLFALLYFLVKAVCWRWWAPDIDRLRTCCWSR